MFWGKGNTSDAKLVHYCKVWAFLHGRQVELTIRGVLVIFEFLMSRKHKFLTLLVHVHMLKHRKGHLPPFSIHVLFAEPLCAFSIIDCNRYTSGWYGWCAPPFRTWYG
jgi:hypothetical protein